MNLYLSATGNTHLMDIVYSYPLDEINILCSFEYKNALFDHKPTVFKNFISDSGAFTAMNAGKKITEQYILDYGNWVKENNVKNYIEMDLDEVIGSEKTEEIRHKLEKQVGYQSIPVWHLERGEQGWKRMCEEYDYVALSLSGFTKASKWLAANKYKPLVPLLNIARKNHTKVHALGCNRIELMKQYHFFSCDSSCFCNTARFGNMMQFKDGKLVTLRSKTYYLDRDSSRVQTIKAFMEMMRYAEQKM